MNNTLWDDIINDKQLYDQFMNIIVKSYKSGKYQHLFIRSVEHVSKIIQWYKNNIVNSNKYGYLKNYVQLGL